MRDGPPLLSRPRRPGISRYVHIWMAGASLATGSGRAPPARLDGEAECAVAVEERGGRAGAGSLDGEEAQFGGDPSIGREAPGLAARREHAMARHDDWEWVAPERLPHVARQFAPAQARGNFSVRQRLASGNAASDLVDATIELLQALHVERNAGEIARLAREKRDDVFDCGLHLGRRRRFACVGTAPRESRAGPRRVRFGELHGDDAALAPGDAAGADVGVEQREALFHHGAAILAPAAPPRLPVLARELIRVRSSLLPCPRWRCAPRARARRPGRRHWPRCPPSPCRRDLGLP